MNFTRILLLVCSLLLTPCALRAQYLTTSMGLSNTVPITATNTYTVASSNWLDLRAFSKCGFELVGSGSNTNTNTLTLSFEWAIATNRWQPWFDWTITSSGTNAYFFIYPETNVGIMGWARLRTVGSTLTNTFTNATLNAIRKGFRRD